MDPLIVDLIDLNVGKVHEAEAMAGHTTFEIGGPCRALVEPTDYLAVAKLVRHLRKHEIPFMVIGLGSNLLFKDEGTDMVVIKIAENLSNVNIHDTTVVAQAGASLIDTSKASMEMGLTGMEPLSGIPGTIGGAITMNAGAYDGEISKLVISVKAIDQDSELQDYSRDEMNFGYRSSLVQEKGLIVLETTLVLETGDYDEIWAKFEDLDERRNSKQPLDLPSAGSMFKRPPGHYASKLISDAGLRGYRVGNAMVSEKHCGFVVTVGESSYEEIDQVIKHVQKVIKEKYDVDLETEVKVIES